MKRSTKTAALIALLAGVTLAGQTSQTPVPQTPTFKVQVDFVDVDVLVTDQQGRFVRDLTKDDFQVFEDGKRQSIANFSVVDIPVERFDRPLYSPEPFEPVFAEARAVGLASVPHAGEVAGAGSVRSALEALGASRIRHGISAEEDPGLVRELAIEARDRQ